MRILPNGDYQLDDGRVVPAGEVGQQYKKAPKSESIQPLPKEEKVELAEGQSSGPMRLED